MSIWSNPNVAYNPRYQDLAAPHEVIFAADKAREDSQSIERPTSTRTTGEAHTAFLTHNMATEVLGDTAHRPFNSADIWGLDIPRVNP